MIKKLIALIALAMAATFALPGAASAKDYTQPGWWDVPNFTGFGPAMDKWSYADFPIRCNNDSTANAWKVIYVYPNGTGNDLTTTAGKDGLRESIRRGVSMYAASAKRAGTASTMGMVPRFDTFAQADGTCHPSFAQIELPAGISAVDPVAMEDYLKSIGYNAANRSYIVVVDQNRTDVDGLNMDSRYSFAWSESISNVSSPNGNIGFGGIIAHEMAHAMGAVSIYAPNGYYGHTSRLFDLMGDEAATSTVTCGTASDDRYRVRMDCKNSDYFMTWDQTQNGRAPGFLATHCAVNDSPFMWGSFPTKGQCSND